MTNFRELVTLVSHLHKYLPSMISFSWRHAQCARREGAVCVRHVIDGEKVGKGNAAERIR